MSEPRSAIDDLPEAMFDEALQKYKSQVYAQMESYFVNISDLRSKIREKLLELGFLKNISEIVKYPKYPTTCGVDGAFAISKHLMIDVVGIAAVAVEGLTPPKEDRKWPKPHHLIEIFPVEHRERTSSVCRGLMFSFELELANRAPHSIVLLDGSLTSQLIALGMSFSAIEKNEVPISLSESFLNRAEKTLKNYLNVLKSEKTDQIFAGLPKYSSRSEIIQKLIENFPEFHNIPLFKNSNDKGFLSLVLKPDEVVGPIPLQKSEEEGKWHLSGLKGEYEEFEGKIVEALNSLHVLYYKPSPSQPALRVEIPGTVALNTARLSILLKGLMDQAKFAGIIEPYPLFLADMFVKNLGFALSEIKNIVESDIGSLDYINTLDSFLAMHEYRSVGGYE
ncbi:MAG: DNA double-strand break repair nuclease NurA [Archaeoglobaceae archaeon]